MTVLRFRRWVLYRCFFFLLLGGFGLKFEGAGGRVVGTVSSRFCSFSFLGSWFLVLGSWFLVLGSWFLVLGSWFLLSSWFLVLLTSYLFLLLLALPLSALLLLLYGKGGGGV